MSAATVQEEKPDAAVAGEIRRRVRPQHRDFLRTVRILAELLITAGVVLLLFIAWQLWWTNLESDATSR